MLKFPVKIIHRAILKELFISLLIVLPALNFILMMEKVLKLSRFLSSVGASPREMARIVVFTQPELFLVTLPLGFMFSVLYTYGRLNADNELLVMRVSGMSFPEVARPVFLLGAACILAGFAVSFSLAPEGKKAVRAEVSGILRERAPRAIEPGVFNTLIQDTLIYAQGGADNVLRGLFIYDERKRERPVVIYASEGSIRQGGESGIGLTLKDGLIHIVKDDRLTEIFFGTYHLVLPMALEEPGRKLAELTPGKLLDEARALKGNERTRRLIEFHKRLTYPLFTLAVMFLAPVLSLYSGKRARLGGLAIGTMVFTAYYIMTSYTERLAGSGGLHHAPGGWLPLAIMLAVSVYAFEKASRR
jgi:LPS export ABC transporter permease LptF